MSFQTTPIRGRAIRSAPSGPDLAARLRCRVAGQDEAVETIVPYVELFEAGLSPEGRPVGVFLLLGPTGTGKTRTVEALAEALHGSERNVLRVDCGEFQLEHEVAKLIGAPPGYLGHRETHPMISQHKLNAVASERSSLSVILFDEIEKAAPSMVRLLLGVLDKASLKLGDNTAVNFERSLIFMTSNLGAREMEAEFGRRYGLAGLIHDPACPGRLDAIGASAVRRRFSPEFVNRIDRMITYRPLARPDIERILDLQLAALERHISTRLGPAAFRLRLTGEAREFLIDRGVSPRYGARELKRVIHRHIIQPLARLVLDKTVEPGAVVRLEPLSCGSGLRLVVEELVEGEDERLAA
ncbi:MAG: ATP-dependent Clp protease ATP-binding subunit [Candidatus Solibacter usitatus]|nr:ATP-dependent Clp protease ATP-binding subunit [Candidatus Solibacter usitatus]